MWESASNHHYCSNPTAIISVLRQLRLIIEARHRQDSVQLARKETEWDAVNSRALGKSPIYKHIRYLSTTALSEGHTHTSVHSSAAEGPGKAASSLITALTSEPGRHPQPRGGQTHRSCSLTLMQHLLSWTLALSFSHSHTQVDKGNLFGS